MIAHTVVDSPLGPLTLVERDGALGGLYVQDQRHLPASPTFGPYDDAVLPDLREQLTAYFAGELTTFDVELSPVGTPFQLEVWAALREVPYGSTCTYADLAREIGRDRAVRAVGAANGRNPISVVVPCHRVVGSDGALRGYAGGLHRKQLLLDLERRTRGGGQTTLPLSTT